MIWVGSFKSLQSALRKPCFTGAALEVHIWLRSEIGLISPLVDWLMSLIARSRCVRGLERALRHRAQVVPDRAAVPGGCDRAARPDARSVQLQGPLPTSPGEWRGPYHPSGACLTMCPPSFRSPRHSLPALEQAKHTGLLRVEGCPRVLAHAGMRRTPQCSFSRLSAVLWLLATFRKRDELVGPKNSCGFARVVFQEPSEPFATVNRACSPFVCS